MNRLATLAMITVSLLFVGVGLLAGDSTGYTQQRSDSDNVKAAVDAFHGWDAVKKDWQDGVFGFWAELKLSPKHAPRIHIDQGTAWTTGLVGVEGKNKSGQALSFTIIETQVYEKHGDRWDMVSHHASQVPE